MIQAIFFDFNGVIINDEHIHLNAYREVLLGEGVALSDEDYFASLGMDDVAFVKAAYARCGHSLNDETLQSVIRLEHETHRRLIENDLPVDSATVTFIKAAARHYQLGVVSMAVQSQIDHVLLRAHLDNLFTVVVTAGQVTRHKPAADCYELGLALLNEQRSEARLLPLRPAECLVIEDAPPGIAAGRAAGMRTMGVTNTVSEAELRAAGADVVTSTLFDWTTAAVQLVFG